MKKILLMLMLSAFLLSGCGAKDSGNSMPVETNQPSESMSNSEQTEESKQTEENSSQQSLSERIVMEISAAEEQEAEVDKKLEEEAVTQLEMNEAAEETYKLWDDTLNVVWGLLEANPNEADMEVLRKENGLHSRTQKCRLPERRMKAEACNHC